MSKFSVPDEREAEIISRNGMDPKEYAVILREENYIQLLCYKTRDTIDIRKGDKQWPK